LHIATNFLDVVEGALSSLLKVAKLSLGTTLALLRLEAELDCIVAMHILASDVEHVARSSLDDSYRYALALGSEHLGHSQFLSQKPFWVML
jgi:hypothetical protein